MKRARFVHLTSEQEWITAGENHLRGEETARYLQAHIRSLNRVCLSAG